MRWPPKPETVGSSPTGHTRLVIVVAYNVFPGCNPMMAGNKDFRRVITVAVLSVRTSVACHEVKSENVS
jgi:hypothetical protein